MKCRIKSYNLKAWIKKEEVGGKSSLPCLIETADAAKIMALKHIKDLYLLRPIAVKHCCLLFNYYDFKTFKIL